MSTEPNLGLRIGLAAGDSSKLSLPASYEVRPCNDVSIGGKVDDAFLDVYDGVDAVKSSGSVLLLLSILSSGFSIKISGTGIAGGAPRRESRRMRMAFLNLRDQ